MFQLRFSREIRSGMCESGVDQEFKNDLSYLARQKRRNGIAYLNVLLGAVAAEEVAVRKSLEPSCFPDCKRPALSRIEVNIVMPIFCNVAHDSRAGLVS